MHAEPEGRRLCLITGASAGIGEAFARLYGDRGYDLALVARRGDRLNRIADEIRLRTGVEILCIEADLADLDATDRILAEVNAHGRTVSALVNNAGFGLTGTFATSPWPEHMTQLQVMLIAVCEMTQKVLPSMQAARFGRIVNVASVAGLMPGSMGDTLYAPLKSFLIKFSQGLHLENRDTGVHVSALCPGYTYSEFHDVNRSREKLKASMPPWMWMGADEVVAAGYEAVEANRAVCVPGVPYKAITALAKLIPDEWALWFMGRDHGFIRG